MAGVLLVPGILRLGFLLEDADVGTLPKNWRGFSGGRTLWLWWEDSLGVPRRLVLRFGMGGVEVLLRCSLGDRVLFVLSIWLRSWFWGALPEDPFSLDDVVLGRHPLELVEEVVECLVVGVGGAVPVAGLDFFPVGVELPQERDYSEGGLGVGLKGFDRDALVDHIADDRLLKELPLCLRGVEGPPLVLPPGRRLLGCPSGPRVRHNKKSVFYNL